MGGKAHLPSFKKEEKLRGWAYAKGTHPNGKRVIKSFGADTDGHRPRRALVPQQRPGQALYLASMGLDQALHTPRRLPGSQTQKQ